MKLLNGEEVKEESKQAVQQKEEKKVITLFEVANVNWDYFSPENCEKIRIQNIVPNAKQAKMLRDEIKRTHKEFDEMKAAMDAVTSRTTLSTKEDVRNMA